MFNRRADFCHFPISSRLFKKAFLPNSSMLQSAFIHLPDPSPLFAADASNVFVSMLPFLLCSSFQYDH